MLKGVQTASQLFYAIVLLAASSETTGMLSAACLVGGILNVVTLVLLFVVWGIAAGIEGAKK